MSSENTQKPTLRIVEAAGSAQTAPATGKSDSAALNVCPLCNGTGVEVVAGKGARPCGCRKRDSRRAFVDAARIPPRFRESSLDNYQPRNESQVFALAYARKLVEDYHKGVEKGLLLMGGVGVGKTHLAIGIMRGLLSQGVPCLFYESGSLLKAIQESYSAISQTSEMRVLAPVFEAEVLVLDELGATVSTDWVRDTMYQIINKRYNDRKLTIFTTNLPEEVRIERTEVELPAYAQDFSDAAIIESDQYKTGNRPDRSDKPTEKIRNYALEERITTRLRSRLFEMCKKVEISGEDYRRRFESLT